MLDMTPEQRFALIEERHASLAQQVTILSEMQVQTERELQELKRMQEKTDKRINRLFEITLRIGADFATRLNRLEKGEDDSAA